MGESCMAHVIRPPEGIESSGCGNARVDFGTHGVALLLGNMKRPVSAPFLASISFQILVAQTQPAPQPQNSATATSGDAAQPPKPNRTDNGTYVNSKGQTVKRPENCSAAP